MQKIPLTRGKFAMVDDEDYDFLNQWKWNAHRGANTFYATRGVWIKERKKMKEVAMHRVILGLTDSKIHVDHKDHNGLNNQKENIRRATPSQNCANIKPKEGKTSKFLGVSKRTDNGKWKAEIRKNNIGYRLGTFNNEVDAAKAYNEAAKKLHGEFANLNTI